MVVVVNAPEKKQTEEIESPTKQANEKPNVFYLKYLNI